MKSHETIIFESHYHSHPIPWYWLVHIPIMGSDPRPSKEESTTCPPKELHGGGTPKSSILMGFSLINQPFGGTPIYGNPPHAHYKNKKNACVQTLHVQEREFTDNIHSLPVANPSTHGDDFHWFPTISKRSRSSPKNVLQRRAHATRSENWCPRPNER